MKPTCRGLIAVALFWSLGGQTYAQTEFFNAITQDLGWPTQPSDADLIAPLEDYGTLEGMADVGYQVGDTVADFTVYDFHGNSITLSEELTGDKPVIFINSSVSCIRFRNMFDVNVDSPDNTSARAYAIEHQDDFNWIFIYNLEAHPSDGNCPSNCPPVPTLDTAVTQGPDYLYRRYAMHNWETHGPPYDFPFTMYCDNPDNSVYNHFSRRPFGLLVISCEGIVLARADWANQFLTFEQDFLNYLLDNDYQVCEQEETVSIGSIENSTSVISPNPAKEHFRISGLEGNGRIRIFEPSGRLALDMGIHSLNSEMEIANLPGGYYVVQVVPDSGKTLHMPLIIE